MKNALKREGVIVNVLPVLRSMFVFVSRVMSRVISARDTPLGAYPRVSPMARVRRKSSLVKRDTNLIFVSAVLFTFSIVFCVRQASVQTRLSVAPCEVRTCAPAPHGQASTEARAVASTLHLESSHLLQCRVPAFRNPGRSGTRKEL